MASHHQKGQVLMELLIASIFLVSLLGVLEVLFKKSQKQLHKYTPTEFHKRRAYGNVKKFSASSR